MTEMVGFFFFLILYKAERAFGPGEEIISKRGEFPILVTIVLLIEHSNYYEYL